MEKLIKSADGHEEGYVIKTDNGGYFSTNELLDWCFDSDFNRADIYDSIEECKDVLKINEVGLENVSVKFLKITKDVKYREYEIENLEESKNEKK